LEHHLVAAQLENLIERVNVDRADFDASHTCRARPDLLGLDRVADDLFLLLGLAEGRKLFVGMITKL
jgi:hypothetical protein